MTGMRKTVTVVSSTAGEVAFRWNATLSGDPDQVEGQDDHLEHPEP